MRLNIHDIWSDYELIDSGNHKKLEQFGEICFIRPESSATHKAHLSFAEWEELAHAEFIQESRTSGTWRTIKTHANEWKVSLPDTLNATQLTLRKTGFKHLGVFPEQILNWQFISQQPKGKLLNLFGYTGISSIVAAQVGFEVCHVDALKQLVQWGKSMMFDNHLKNTRWICDDAPTFVQREIRRGNRYDLILADPPAFGHGKAKRPWKIEKDLIPFLLLCKQILNSNAIISLSVYTEKLHLKDLIQEIIDIGFTLEDHIKIDGEDRFGQCIDHGYILRLKAI